MYNVKADTITSVICQPSQEEVISHDTNREVKRIEHIINRVLNPKNRQHDDTELLNLLRNPNKPRFFYIQAKVKTNRFGAGMRDDAPFTSRDPLVALDQIEQHLNKPNTTLGRNVARRLDLPPLTTTTPVIQKKLDQVESMKVTLSQKGFVVPRSVLEKGIVPPLNHSVEACMLNLPKQSDHLFDGTKLFEDPTYTEFEDSRPKKKRRKKLKPVGTPSTSFVSKSVTLPSAIRTGGSSTLRTSLESRQLKQSASSTRTTRQAWGG